MAGKFHWFVFLCRLVSTAHLDLLHTLKRYIISSVGLRLVGSLVVADAAAAAGTKKSGLCSKHKKKASIERVREEVLK
jgi:hypothetical protein